MTETIKSPESAVFHPLTQRVRDLLQLDQAVNPGQKNAFESETPGHFLRQIQDKDGVHYVVSYNAHTSVVKPTNQNAPDLQPEYTVLKNQNPKDRSVKPDRFRWAEAENPDNIFRPYEVAQINSIIDVLTTESENPPQDTNGQA